jgi:ribosomal-protein-alanine N-acetyltransferase
MRGVMTELAAFHSLSEFPTLQTDRLVLRELRAEDVAQAHRMFSDPEVMRYVGKVPHTSVDQSMTFIHRNQALFPARDGIRWAMTRRGSDELIGSCGHWRLYKEHFRSEIGYDLLPAYWGQGLMTEALRAILAFGFTCMGLHSVEAQIDPLNERSRRVLTQLGFTQDGLLRENFYFAGQFTDTAVFTLLAREFLPAAT